MNKKQIEKVYKIIGKGFVIGTVDNDDTALAAHNVSVIDMIAIQDHLRKVISEQILASDKPSKKSSPKKKVAKKTIKKVTKK